jgi:hypothetical protein
MSPDNFIKRLSGYRCSYNVQFTLKVIHYPAIVRLQLSEGQCDPRGYNNQTGLTV